MKLNSLKKAMAVGLFAATSGFAMQANAVPVFTFTEVAGFTGGMVPIATYVNQVINVNGPSDPSASPVAPAVYEEMNWVNGLDPKSSLLVDGTSGALPANVWTDISQLTHNNVIIPTATNWGPQDIWGRFIITDNNGGATERLDNNEPITISFVETANVTDCPGPNPNGSHCDDIYTFTNVGLASLPFTANDGSNWMVDFRLGGLDNAVVIGNTVYTAESQTSHIHVQALVRQVPEPGTLALLGLGLLGLGFAKRRSQFA